MSKKNLQEVFDKQALDNKRANNYKQATNLGKKFSEEHRAKIGAAHKGKTVSEETRAKMREAHVGHTGNTHSEESRSKMSASLKGREVWNKGIPATDLRKANISRAKAGKANPKKYKPIMTPNGLFPSKKEALLHIKSLDYKMKKHPDQYYYVEKCDEQS